MRKNELIEAPPLPANIDDWTRHIKAERTLNDLVEDLHRILVNESEEYRAYLRAVDDRLAITGSMDFDDFKACDIIKAKAVEIGSAEVAQEKHGIINLALGVVLRRYKASRRQRRNMLRGQVVAENGED